MSYVTATERELRREAKKIASLMRFRGMGTWMAEEVVRRQTMPMYVERLTPMVKEELEALG